jgi:chromosomal replication initiation ATPase DnaA
MTFTPTIQHGHITRPTTCRVQCFRPCRSNDLIQAIQQVVSEAFNVPVWTMTAKARPEHWAKPRMIAMSLARELTPISLCAIGEAFGGRDHATVLHAMGKVRDWVQVEPGLGALIEQLKAQVRK